MEIDNRELDKSYLRAKKRVEPSPGCGRAYIGAGNAAHEKNSRHDAKRVCQKGIGYCPQSLDGDRE